IKKSTWIMIFRIIETNYKDKLKTWPNRSMNDDKHEVYKTRVTWYILFIPVFWYEKIYKSEI
ncbi:unnamed protein product, partial [marine sediment metagenome]